MKRSIFCLIFLAVSAAAATLVESGAKVALVDGYLMVEVKVNHRGPFRMLLDTGASSCMLTPKAGQDAGLIYDHQVILLRAGGSERAAQAASVNVRVGAVEADSVEVSVDRLEGARRLDARLEGVLGQSFLGRLPYLLDYRRKRLLLGEEAREASSRLGPEIAVTNALGRVLVPVIFTTGGPLRQLALDAGASNVILQCGHECPPLDNAESSGRILTNAGEWRVRSGRMAALSVGGLTIYNPEVGLLEAPPQPQEDGVLPARLFSAVYVDCQRGVVRLAR